MTDQEAALEAAKELFDGNIASIGDVVTDPRGKALPLVARICAVIESLPDVDPEGKNDHFRYKYITDKQVLGLLRPRLSRQKILIVPETVEEREPLDRSTAKGGSSMVTRITVTWRVIDGIYDGVSFTGQSVGYGDDSGDKGANKAYTSAYKNFLIKLFDIGGDTDVEDDKETDRRADAREAGAERVTRVKVEDVEIEGVERGGRARKATEAQIARVGQYARDLQLSPEGLAGVMTKALGADVVFPNWDTVRPFLVSMSGNDIGKTIEMLASLYDAAQEETWAAAGVTDGDDGRSD